VINELLVMVILNFIVVGILSLYIMTNLQWYNYKIKRVLFKHHKRRWHLYFFVLPAVLYIVGIFYNFVLYSFIIYIPFFIRWYSSLDKKLVFTSRVRIFFMILFIVSIIINMVVHIFIHSGVYCILLPIVSSLVLSSYYEKRVFERYHLQALSKFATMPRLKIIAITGSYGKTSMKNFVADILSNHYKVYATPRSVNTLAGIIKDINENLPSYVDYYIVEAGARSSGDILEITNLLQQTYGVVGKVGEAHIEYFESIQNTIMTKLEILQSPFLKKAFIQKELKKNEHIPKNMNIVYYPKDIRAKKATLDGVEFELNIGDKWYLIKAPVLGSINIENIALAIDIALEVGISIEQIIEDISHLKSVEHRLQKIEAGGKIIIDDSYNGNFEGISSAIELAKQHNGKKVIVTPGLVESNDELNIKIAKQINETFDIAIITGELNSKLYSTYIKSPQKILLKEKDLLQNILASHTKSGDLILFANDAPSYI